MKAKQRKRELQDERRRERASDRERQRIFEEEERKFYEAQGLQRHISRHGAVEWLTPEEIEKRRQTGKERYRVRKKKKWIQRWMVVGRVFALVVIVGGLGGALYSMRSLRGAEKEAPVTVLFPNEYSGSNLLADARVLHLPDSDTWRLKARLPDGAGRSEELITVVATKANIPFSGHVGRSETVVGGFLQLKYEARAEALARWLVEIPLDQRAEASFAFWIAQER